MKLNYKRTFLVGFAFMAICAFWQMYDNIIPLILQNTFGLKDGIIGVIMATDNVLAVFLLPVVGAFSDRVDTRFGKRTPFIVGGTAAAVAVMMLLPLSDRLESFPMFVFALGATLIAMAMYRSPAVALMPDLTPKPLRSKANAVINLMGAIGGVYTLILISTLVGEGKRPSYFAVFAGVAGMMVLSVVLLLLTIREKKLAKQLAEEYPEENREENSGQAGKIGTEKKTMEKDVKRSLILILISIFLWFAAYNAVTTAFSRYAMTVWDIQGGGYANCLMVATVAAILSYIPIGMISSKIGRKKTILGGIVLMTACYLLAALLPNYHPIIQVGFALIGVGWAAISVNSLPMVVEMSRDSDVGKYTGLYYTFSMTAQIVTPILSGFLLQHISYRILFPYAVFFSGLAFVTMSLVKHGDNKPEAKKDLLEHFDVED
ncbi:MFS transporter [Fusibacillus kribbianus]|uniref:MFS transporter n=1 Tax=Fusibacillus kribbianus TaxID=3044208 RepID=A0AAP4EZ60_9FIRM|nr:MFS transporter [Ruminococcus sp. YH-rum2234]MDI9241525.1 MFS transporter [Ruminococcus sp. YH-rum2234]